MLSYQPQRQELIPTSALKIVGLGGAGANMLDRAALEGMDGVDLLALNTDIRTLTSSVASEKIQLGTNLTKGLGAGGDPELGRNAVLEAEVELRESLRGHKIVFICVGLGGGTGSGAAPVVTRIAREEGAFTVVFATMPFSFEGRRRREQAGEALNEIMALSNALVTFDNGRMGELILAKQGIHEAFASADLMISQCIKAVTRLVVKPGLINIGLDDLVTALKTNSSRCLFGTGTANGQDRAQKALTQALASPLLDKGSLLEDAGAVLVHIAGGEDMTLYEVELLMSSLSKNVSKEAHIIFGAAMDKEMQDKLSVTLISALPEDKIGIDSFNSYEDEEEATQFRSAETPHLETQDFRSATYEEPENTQEPYESYREEDEPTKEEDLEQNEEEDDSDTFYTYNQAPPADADEDSRDQNPSLPQKNETAEADEEEEKSAPPPPYRAPEPQQLYDNPTPVKPPTEHDTPNQPKASQGSPTPQSAANAPFTGRDTKERPASLTEHQTAPPQITPQEPQPKHPPLYTPISHEQNPNTQQRAENPTIEANTSSTDTDDNFTATKQNQPQNTQKAETNIAPKPTILPPEPRNIPETNVPKLHPEEPKEPAAPDDVAEMGENDFESVTPADNDKNRYRQPNPGTTEHSHHSPTSPTKKDPSPQKEFNLESTPKGRFEGETPNLFDGEDIDIPPYLRRKKS